MSPWHERVRSALTNPPSVLYHATWGSDDAKSGLCDIIGSSEFGDGSADGAGDGFGNGNGNMN